MKTEPKTKFTKDIVRKAISLLLALTDSLPVLILYIFTVLWYTVLNRAENYEIPQLELFWSFRKFLTGDPRLGIEIVANVIMFMPFGFLLSDLFCNRTHVKTSSQSVYPMASPASNLPSKRGSIRKNSQFVVSSAFSPSDYPMIRSSEILRKWLLIPLLALSFSLLIEILQMTLVRGLAEADDLVTNTLGAVLGICSYEVLRKLSEARFFEVVLAIIQKNPIRIISVRKTLLSSTESGTIHRFKALSSAIRAAFVLICLTVLIFDRKIYPLKENNLTRSFCFQVDEASTQGNMLTLRGFAFGYNHRPVSPRLILRPTGTVEPIDTDVSLRQTKSEDRIAMDVNSRHAKNEDRINLNVNYGAARPDVNEYFLCDYNYTNVGFTATGIVNPETEYEILIGWPPAKPVSTGVYILREDVHRVAYAETYNGELIETKKEKGPNATGREESPFGAHGTESLNVTTENEHFSSTEKETLCEATEKEHPSDTDEEEILIGTTQEENLAGIGQFELPDLPTDYVKNGTLLVCRPDMHIWVFQYNGYLYWVADKGFHFEDNGMTYIQYHLWTTQLQNLPSDRLEKKYLWDNIGGYFEKHELSGDFGKYRVMCRELPTEYAIASILTGYYKDGEWSWANSFRPVYVF